MEGYVDGCYWHHVYDIIEAIYNWLNHSHAESARTTSQKRAKFEAEVNQAMVDFGIGWKLEGGLIRTRGEEYYEAHLKTAMETLKKTMRQTALTELKEATLDVSRRPAPDTSGAIQHAMAALECVARDVTKDSNPTLGKLIQSHPDLLPKPVDQAVVKLWGYASEIARHGKEGNAPAREEAMLIVDISATLVNYLIQRSSNL